MQTCISFSINHHPSPMHCVSMKRSSPLKAEVINNANDITRAGLKQSSHLYSMLFRSFLPLRKQYLPFNYHTSSISFSISLIVLIIIADIEHIEAHVGIPCTFLSLISLLVVLPLYPFSFYSHTYTYSNMNLRFIVLLSIIQYPLFSFHFVFFCLQYPLN